MPKVEIKPRSLKTAASSQYVGLSPRAMLDLAHQGKIPYIKAGARSVLFDITDLDRFLDERKVGGCTHA